MFGMELMERANKCPLPTREVLRQTPRLETGVSDIATTSTGFCDFCETLRRLLKDVNFGLRIGFSTSDRGKKT